MKTRIVQDVSGLPTHAFGPRMTMWWGTLGFCVIEGTGFALAIAGHLYLSALDPRWNVGVAPPRLLWGVVNMVLVLVSLVPNFLAEKAARDEDIGRVRLWLSIMSLIALATVIVRGAEIAALPMRWDQGAYASFIWLLLGLHTLHLVTDVADTLVLTVLMFTRHGKGKRFSDVEDNAFYWYFVVGSWVPLHILIYWAPRWS